MKAISLWPPYGSLIVAGVKKIETRSWPTSHRGVIAIHHTVKWMPETDALMASSKAFALTVEKLGGVQVGCIVGTIEIVGCEIMTPENIGSTSIRESILGWYEPGRWMWKLANPVKFDEPIPAKGKQGIWEWEPACV